MVKEILLKKAEKELDKHFPVKILKELGLKRKVCKICGRSFWTFDENREFCGDHEEYSFIGQKIINPLKYEEVWEDFSKFLEKRGYTPIKRYPVVARWRDDLEFVIASIADFQPYVVNGEVDPPARKLTVPQFCLRFTDIDNVGLTSRHYTGFVMIGQHTFVPPEEYDMNAYFKDLLDWFIHLGIPPEEFVFHEDVWEGGGNAGTSIEFFVKGVEIANQVYMQYSVENGNVRELEKIKVLDMGMGQERVAWFSQGTYTSYDATFPSVISLLKENSLVELDYEFFKKFVRYSYSLDATEEDFDKNLSLVAKKLDISLEVLKEKIEPFIAMYSIAEHTRTLLVSISDGGLPSNTGGGYNLRVIFRRAYGFYEKFFANLDFYKIFEKHLDDIEKQFSELKDRLDIVLDVIDNEIKKYKESRERAKKIIKKYSGKKLSDDKLVELYISHGIRPEDLGITPSRDFYLKIVQFRERSRAKEEREEIVLSKDYEETRKVYYEDWKIKVWEARVIGKEKEYYIFNETLFYPTGGGQQNDTGWLIPKEEFLSLLSKYPQIEKDYILEVLTGMFGKSGRELFEKYVKDIIKEEREHTAEKELISMYNFREDLNKITINVTDAIKVGKVVLHKTDKELQENKEYIQVLNWERRLALTRNHDAVHILTGTLRKYYGDIVWQAGAEKTPEKARLDVTYYKLPSKKEIMEIERMVNKIVLENRKIKKSVMPRNLAEQKYGFSIYQGGAVPGRELRIVEIENWDVEACGGTHGDETGYIGFIKITNVEKISDSTIRFEIVTGEKAIEYVQRMGEILEETAKIARVGIEDIPSTMKKFFDNWKNSEKNVEKLIDLISEFLLDKIKDRRLELKVPEGFDEELISKIIATIRKKLDIDEVIIYNDSVGISISNTGNAKKNLENLGYKKIVGSEKFAKGFN